MPIGIYTAGDLILHTVSGSGDVFVETKISAATSSLILFDSNGNLSSASLNSVSVGTSSNSMSASYALTSSFATNSALASTASYVVLAQTASYVLGSGVSGTVTSASYALTSSFATTASYASNVATTALVVTTAAGTADQVLVNGGTSAVTGAVTVSLPSRVITSAFSGSSFTSSITSGIGFVGTASYANAATSASYALTSSFATNSALASTASYVVTAQTASYVVLAQTASYVLGSGVSGTVTSASYALTSSFATTASFYGGSVASASFAASASYSLSSSYANNSLMLGGQLSSYYIDTSATNQTKLGSLIIGTSAAAPYRSYFQIKSANHPYIIQTLSTAGVNYQRHHTSNRWVFDDTVNIWTSSVNSNPDFYAMDLEATRYSFKYGSLISSSTSLTTSSYDAYEVSYFNGSGWYFHTGSVTLPGISFTSDTNTGIYSPSSDIMGLSAGGSEKLRITATNISASVPITASLHGTASWANNSISASYALSSSYALTSSFATNASLASTASYVVLAQTASYVLGSGVSGTVTSASYALSSSFSENARSASYAVTSSFASTIPSYLSGVLTLTGTTNQVLVNGGLGPVSGSVTLTLPQSIATTSTPTFGGMTLTSASVSSSSNILLLVNPDVVSVTNQSVHTLYRTYDVTQGRIGSRRHNSGFVGNLDLEVLASNTTTTYPSDSDYVTGIRIIKSQAATGELYVVLVPTTGSVGIGVTNPINKLQIAGNVSGSSFTSSITNAIGFVGTASYAQNGLSSSYALSSSFAANASTASYVLTAQTASYLTVTNSYNITALTASGPIIYKNAVLLDYSSSGLATTGANYVILQNQTGSYNSAFFDYFAVSASNFRAGTVIAGWTGGNLKYTEYSTVDMGNTSQLSMSAAISSSFIQLLGNASALNWTVKSSGRYV